MFNVPLPIPSHQLEKALGWAGLFLFIALERSATDYSECVGTLYQ